MAKVTVRIPVAVDPEGKWIGYGWGDIEGRDEEATHAFAVGWSDLDKNERYYWITADLDIPEATTMAGTVEEAE